MIKRDITYHWGEDYLLISLGNRIEPRLRWLFLAEFLLTSGVATVFLLQSRPVSANLVHFFTGSASALIYLLAAYRFLSRMVFTEKIQISNQGISIIQRTPFYKQAKSYSWLSMGPLHYVGKPAKTDHPLKGNSFDYFGFETQEHLIQSLHHNGNLCFYCDGEEIRFARGVYSWDAEKMIRMIKLYVGNSLRLGPEWEHMLQEHEIDQ